MVGELKISQVMEMEEAVFFDLRSPVEFQCGSIPGAYNVPLFDDQQRRELGIIYHKEGPGQASLRGLEIAASRLPQIVRKILDRSAGRTPVLYCWRGGLRSRSVVTALRLMNIEAWQLAGGYKAFRRFIFRQLKEYNFQGQRIYVIHGLTGVGKTRIVQSLAADGCPAIDLEGLANHRGSVFGHIGMGEKVTQKDFEARLYMKLRQYQDFPYLIVEGEGKRIGALFLPQALVSAMQEGEHLLVEAPLDKRVQNILEDYNALETDIDAAEIKRAIESISRRLRKKTVAELYQCLEKRDLAQVVRILCTDYYDRLYNDSKPEKHHFSAVFVAADHRQAAEEIKNYLGCK
ncbi:MAG: tRNA 2-selenouridine(34) synthase MnmH [Dethiobacteria bacterium]|jgi:tRNA 2-selenouridine synthase